MSITIPSHLSDADLGAALSRWRHDERRTTAHVVAHLAEFDARRLHLKAGFSSSFAYCVEVLGLSEHGAYNRIEAARAARRFPTILERLQQGSLNLATVRLLAPRLTEENHRELLDAAAGHSKREVEELVARRFPRPDVPSSVRKVPERRRWWIRVLSRGWNRRSLPRRCRPLTPRRRSTRLSRSRPPSRSLLPNRSDEGA